MLYMRCHCCGTLLGDKQIPFEERMETIYANKNLTKEQFEKETHAVLSKLKVVNLCCKMLLLTYINLNGLIK